jgi:hypothetical protein
MALPCDLCRAASHDKAFTVHIGSYAKDFFSRSVLCVCGEESTREIGGYYHNARELLWQNKFLTLQILLRVICVDFYFIVAA